MAAVSTNLPESDRFHGDIQAYASDNGYGGLSTCGLYCRRGFTRSTLGIGIDRRRFNGVAEVSLLGAAAPQVESFSFSATETSVEVTVSIRESGGAVGACEVLYDDHTRQRIYAGLPAARQNRYHEPTAFFIDYQAKLENDVGRFVNDALLEPGWTPFSGAVSGSFFVEPVSEDSVSISARIDNTMSVTGVFLLSNTVNDLGTATEIDVTFDLAPIGGTYTLSGLPPNALRYYWIRLVDSSANETIESLGSYTTQDNTPPTIDTFTLSPGATPTTEMDVGFLASDNDAVQTIYLLVSDTQTTAPTAAEIKASGTALTGNATSSTLTGLSANTTYFGWLLARDQVGNESAVVASVPASLTTAPDTVAPSLDSFGLAATPGAEETSVDITISISDAIATA